MDIWNQTKNIIKENHVPLDILWELTRRCNLNCLHCYNVKDNSELTFFQVEDIAGQLKESGTLFVTLTGGEVFIRDDFIKIARLLRRLGFDIKIISNGTLITRAVVRDLKEIWPSEIGISLQGASQATHDAITRTRGSFKKSLQAIRLLIEAGLCVHIKYTAMKENIHEYGKIVELARKLKITYIADPIISPRDDGCKDVLSHRLDNEALGCFYRGWFAEFSQPLKVDSLICEAAKTLGAITAKGDVYPCIQLPLKAGNVFEQEFKDIWANSPLFKRMRAMTNKDLKVCGGCSRAEFCTRCPGLTFLEEGDAWGPSSTACLVAGFYSDFRERLKSGA